MPEVDKATFYIGRVRDYNRWLASVHQAGPAGKPSLDFLHVLLRTARGSTSRTGR